jgi:hypothetical protein
MANMNDRYPIPYKINIFTSIWNWILDLFIKKDLNNTKTNNLEEIE